MKIVDKLYIYKLKITKVKNRKRDFQSYDKHKKKHNLYSSVYTMAPYFVNISTVRSTIFILSGVSLTKLLLPLLTYLLQLEGSCIDNLYLHTINKISLMFSMEYIIY